MAWQPGRRAAMRALEAPYDDVPDHLVEPLWVWIASQLTDVYRNDRTIEIGLYMRLSLPNQSYAHRQQRLRVMAVESSHFMLDLAESILELYGWDAAPEALEELLVAANSNYAVKNDPPGLEVRTPPEIKEQVQAVVDEAIGSAGDHLRNAWNEAYGRRHDAVKSYAESVKAVECALAPNITPQNIKQTLGTMIADVRNAPQNFQFVIPDGDHSDGAQTVLQMMRQLWEGQTRHGGARPTRDETIEEARAAVHLAAALVQWGTSEAFKRK